MTADVYISERQATPLRIILIRHGQTDHNKAGIIQGQTDIPLNDEGRRQAKECGLRVRQAQLDVAEARQRAVQNSPHPAIEDWWHPDLPLLGSVDAVYTSDLKRCKETTDIVVKAAGLGPDIKVNKTPLLRERFMGELENRPAVEGRAMCKAEDRDWDSYGESKTHMVDRLSKIWDEVVSEGLDKNHHTVLVLTHGGCITRFTAHLVEELTTGQFGISPKVSKQSLRSPNNTSFTVFDIDRHTYEVTLQSFADVGHLGGPKQVFNADER